MLAEAGADSPKPKKTYPFWIGFQKKGDVLGQGAGHNAPIKKKSPPSMMKGTLKKGDDILSHKMQ
uniref:hypothetical protein n=1 Tax=Flavobacterium sp. TaxID=239 RepID=UPI0026388A23